MVIQIRLWRFTNGTLFWQDVTLSWVNFKENSNRRIRKLELEGWCRKKPSVEYRELRRA